MQDLITHLPKTEILQIQAYRTGLSPGLPSAYSNALSAEQLRIEEWFHRGELLLALDGLQQRKAPWDKLEMEQMLWLLRSLGYHGSANQVEARIGWEGETSRLLRGQYQIRSSLSCDFWPSEGRELTQIEQYHALVGCGIGFKLHHFTVFLLHNEGDSSVKNLFEGMLDGSAFSSYEESGFPNRSDWAHLFVARRRYSIAPLLIPQLVADSLVTQGIRRQNLLKGGQSVVRRWVRIFPFLRRVANECFHS